LEFLYSRFRTDIVNAIMLEIKGKIYMFLEMHKSA
jgi:hypothetical protein